MLLIPSPKFAIACQFAHRIAADIKIDLSFGICICAFVSVYAVQVPHVLAIVAGREPAEHRRDGIFYL